MVELVWWRGCLVVVGCLVLDGGYLVVEVVFIGGGGCLVVEGGVV